MKLAPAKINLHLQIGEKRSDGFHDIKSLFQMISLYDEIVIRSLTENTGISISGELCIPVMKNAEWRKLLESPENTIRLAAESFCRNYGVSRGFDITIRKNIPLGAGLGGGSSDAAAVFELLNDLTGVHAPQEELAALGAEIGSDVPFFFSCAAGIVTGRGDNIEAIESRDDFHLCIVYPKFSISTAEAYRWFDQKFPVRKNNLHEIALSKMFKIEKPELWRFDNSFRTVLEEKFPIIKELIQSMYQFGAQYANISGSGSAVFGVFDDISILYKGYLRLRRRFDTIWIIQPLDRRTSVVLE